MWLLQKAMTKENNLREKIARCLSRGGKTCFMGVFRSLQGGEGGSHTPGRRRERVREMG